MAQPLRRVQWKYIEDELFHYDQTRRTLADLRLSVIESSPTPDGMPRSGEISDPTYRKAEKLLTSPVLARLERNAGAIERALQRLSSDHRALFELRYRQCMSWERVCEELPTSERTYFRLKRELVLMVGCELGLCQIA